MPNLRNALPIALLLAPLLAPLLALPAAAQSARAADDTAVAPIDKAELRARREALATAISARHPDRRAVVLLRGGEKQAAMGAFAQDQDFLYLTGVAEPDLALLLVVATDGTLERDELLVPPFSRFSAKWDGRFLAPGEASADRTGFVEVGNVRALLRRLDDLLGGDGD
jgi:hypothetical protein